MKSNNLRNVIFVLVVIAIIYTFLSNITEYEEKETDVLPIQKVVYDVAYDFEDRLEYAKEFIIKERILSIGKCYDVFIIENGRTEKIGEIRGKTIRAFRDIFTFYDISGKIIAFEKEQYKIVKLTRAAQMYSADGSLIGYIGEELSTNMFDPGYFFHYYDAQLRKIGYSDQKTFNIMKTNEICDANGRQEYLVQEEISLTNDVFRIKVTSDKTTISKLYVLFSVCIEDAIRDSEEAEAQK